ncbi:hypothetical protein EDB92DRAFT_2106421 [Lactarius akahatsu]|uniref:NACHT domain-containing protein n=1 Tax=Lactarius akahatsu TaxID=416441 RepID=A0AAD4L9T6_9AGAM|nr:hypothetical protein EDB92DRAFT_2106421 [Lactarius akahatsu]
MSQVLATAISSTSFETIFTSALQAYKKRTKKDIASHPLAAELQTCDSPDAILSVLQAQVQVFDQSRSADDRLTKWLNPTVHVLYAFSATLGQGVGMVFPPAKVLFAGIGVLLQVVKDIRDSQEALVDLFGHIGYFFRQLETYIEVKPTAAMTEITVKIMVEVFLILGIVMKEIKQGRIKKYLKVLIGRKDIEGALQRLDKLMQEEARMASAEVLKITHGVEEDVKNVADKVQDVDRTMQGIGERVKGVDDRVKVVGDKVDIALEGTLTGNGMRFYQQRWLSPPDPSFNYNTACDARHMGTSAWCTQGNTFADWHTSGGLLWIYGKRKYLIKIITGSGKTILSSAIIQDMKALSSVGSALMAYFYFDFKDTGKQDARALLSSLLIQLSDQSDPCCDALFSFYSRHKRGSEQPTIDSLMLCLKTMLTTIWPLPTYLIVDALDECPDFPGIPSLREKVLGLVRELVEFRHPNLQLCITSHPEFDIRIALQPWVTQQTKG